MLLTKLFKILVISVGLFSLAACSTAHAPASVDDESGAASGGAGNGATASGLGSPTSFGGGAGGNSMQVGNQSYYFDFDKNDVHDSDLSSIKVQADYLATHPRAKVLLEGNTDERGSREYNIGLGERRATSVEAVLEADGVNKNQITTVSYGAEKPVALGHDEDSYAKNRRVDLVYQTPVS